MSYREWQGAHPHWPKKMEDLIGHKVRLKEGVVTLGGEVFKTGEVLVVTHVYRGRVHAENPLRKDKRGRALGVRFLGLRSLDLCE